MIIIPKAPFEIKSFLDSFRGINSSTQIQETVQRQYADICFSLEHRFTDRESTDIAPGSNGRAIHSVKLILSSNTRKFIIDKSHIIRLQIYQLHTSSSISKYEDILFEPFYPSFQTILTDIYGILKEKPHSKAQDSYRYSSMHTPRMIRILRTKFFTALPHFFQGRELKADSFDNFYAMIHQLNTEQLKSVFGSSIHFIDLS